MSKEEVIDNVCREYGVSNKDIIGKSQAGAISIARQMLCFILFVKMGLEEREVSEAIGGRSTVGYLSEQGRSKIRIYKAEKERFERIWGK